MSKKAVAVAILVVFVAAIAFYELGIAMICDGSYDLTVEFAPDAARGVSGVSFVCASNAEMADAIVAAVEKRSDFSEMENRKTAEPFEVTVGFSYRESNLGRKWGYVQQFSHIVVVLHRVDGTRAVHQLAIPNRNESRRIVVTASNAI